MQVSAVPDAYAREVHPAQVIVEALWSGPDERTDHNLAPVSIYGVLDTSELYYAVIDPASGKRTHTVTSTEKIGFSPKAMATLNFNTILVTSPEGHLHRIDVSTNKNSLSFAVSDTIESGWTHELLAFDGGHLYGIANHTLSRYVVSRPKPSEAQIGAREVIGKGWALRTFTATAPQWLLAVSDAGELLSYHVTGAAPAGVKRYELKPGRWSSVTALVSAGGGYYLGRANDGSMRPYFDADPFDGKGDDIEYKEQVDTKGWTQKLISAVPNFAA